MAKWIVGGGNPLTARVVVNRFWQMHFGTGIVKSSEDFGRRASGQHIRRCSTGCDRVHPWWMEPEGDAQAHRDVVTYQQVSRVSPGLLEVDPANRLFARGPRFRLPAEMIRDHALASSGFSSAGSAARASGRTNRRGYGMMWFMRTCRVLSGSRWETLPP
ncbi:MAG: hypothetical protein Ct9H300mP7_1850 [Verrucomicrobiota bacterium]|nr:MAG: hypothetical protein Ct9H300mP7_1850 [Verrucomicrobiota bacterium]